MTRSQKTENCYRQAMREALFKLLVVMNPQDQISFGALPYAELVAYARDWLDTEIVELSEVERAEKALAVTVASLPLS